MYSLLLRTLLNFGFYSVATAPATCPLPESEVAGLRANLSASTDW